MKDIINKKIILHEFNELYKIDKNLLIIENILIEKYFYDLENNMYSSGDDPNAPFDGYQIVCNITSLHFEKKFNFFLDKEKYKKLERKFKLDDIIR